jgi:hypothetical protein
MCTYYLTDRNAAVAIDQRTNGITFTGRSPDDGAEGAVVALRAPMLGDHRGHQRRAVV